MYKIRSEGLQYGFEILIIAIQTILKIPSMKKILVMAAFLGICATGTAFAQTANPDATPASLTDKVEMSPREQEAAKQKEAKEAKGTKSCCSKKSASASKAECSEKEMAAKKAAGKSSCCMKGHSEAHAQPAEKEKATSN